MRYDPARWTSPSPVASGSSVGWWRVERACLPTSWRAELRGRRLTRRHDLQIQTATTDDEKRAVSEAYLHNREELREDLEAYRSDQLVRHARRYYLVPPAIPWGRGEDDDPHWERGPVSDEWHLRPAAFADLYRQIEDARARRRAVWESWAKIVGGLLSGIIAVLSVIVSLVLALKK